MKSLRILLFALTASAFFMMPDKASAISNRYGMVLIEKSDGSYTIRDARKIEALIGDPYRLPKALVPYESKISVYDQASIDRIVPEDIVYKKSVTGDDLHIMVYRSGRNNSPVAFYIHGGAWAKGSYKGLSAFCKTLAGKYGITVVSIQYSFAGNPGVRMETTVGDCYDAVEYVLARSGEFGIDPERIGFWGGSAGGHLSACCAMHFPQTKALAGWYGAYDLQYTMGFYAPESDARRHKFYDGFFNGWDPDYMDRFSPAKMADPDNNMSFKAILFVGTADITAGPDNAPRYRKALASAGVKNVKLRTYRNVTHSIGASFAGDDMYSRTLRLFVKTL